MVAVLLFAGPLRAGAPSSSTPPPGLIDLAEFRRLARFRRALAAVDRHDGQRTGRVAGGKNGPAKYQGSR